MAGLVYLGSNDNSLLALRASDRVRIWQAGTGGPVASGIAVARGIVYAGSNDSTVRALRARDGDPGLAVRRGRPGGIPDRGGGRDRLRREQ